jgi:hypothetical protein
MRGLRASDSLNVEEAQYEMLSDQGENIVFLLSLPRSGSTILSLVLGNHSAIYCPPEPWFLLKLSALAQPGNVDSAFDDEYATRAAAEFFPPDTLYLAARAFASVCYSRHLEATGKRIFVDKTPRYYHILPFLDRLFPRARKIWLKRNLLDVALSHADSWGIGTEIITGRQITPASLDFAMAPFSLASYFSDTGPTKLEVQYEDLVRSPKNTVSLICRFLQVPFEEQMLDYASNQDLLSQHRRSSVGDKRALSTNSLQATSVGRWKANLPLSDVREIVDFLGLEIFRRMGYDETVESLHRLGISDCSESDAEEARRVVTIASADKAANRFSKVAVLRERLQSTRRELQRQQAENREFRRQLDDVRNSRSWRLTEPLRRLHNAVRNLRV